MWVSLVLLWLGAHSCIWMLPCQVLRHLSSDEHPRLIDSEIGPVSTWLKVLQRRQDVLQIVTSEVPLQSCAGWGSNTVSFCLKALAILQQLFCVHCNWTSRRDFLEVIMVVWRDSVECSTLAWSTQLPSRRSGPEFMWITELRGFSWCRFELELFSS